MPGADVALTLDMARHATLRQAAWTDHIAFLYGVAHPFVPVRRADLREGSGVWVTPRLILNKPFTVPGTGEKRATEIVDIGHAALGDREPGRRRLRRPGPRRLEAGAPSRSACPGRC